MFVKCDVAVKVADTRTLADLDLIHLGASIKANLPGLHPDRYRIRIYHAHVQSYFDALRIRSFLLITRFLQNSLENEEGFAESSSLAAVVVHNRTSLYLCDGRYRTMFYQFLTSFSELLSDEQARELPPSVSLPLWNIGSPFVSCWALALYHPRDGPESAVILTLDCVLQPFILFVDGIRVRLHLERAKRRGTIHVSIRGLFTLLFVLSLFNPS